MISFYKHYIADYLKDTGFKHKFNAIILILNYGIYVSWNALGHFERYCEQPATGISPISFGHQNKNCCRNAYYNRSFLLLLFDYLGLLVDQDFS
jgi:hypothetical protein